MTTIYDVAGNVVPVYDTAGRLIWGTPPAPAPVDPPTPPDGPLRNVITRAAQMGGGESIGGGRLVATRHTVVVDAIKPTLAWNFSTNGIGGLVAEVESTIRVWVSKGALSPQPVTIGGSTSTTFPSSSGMPAEIASDPIPLDLYAGETLTVYVWSGPVGTGKVASSVTSAVAGTDLGWVAQSTPDISAPLTGNGGSPSMRPSRAVAPSDQPAWMLIGDSITQRTDTYSELWATGAGYATVKSGRNGDSYQGQRPGTDRFPGQIAPHLPFATHVLDCFGINDAGAPAEIRERAARFWGQIHDTADVRIVKTTLLPSTTSTDGWQTLAGQTPSSSHEGRLLFNQWLRDGAPLVDGVPAPVGTAGAIRCPVAQNGALVHSGEGTGHPLDGITDIADAVESSQDSGLWATSWPTSAYGDGLHPEPGGPIMRAVADRLAIDMPVLLS